VRNAELRKNVNKAERFDMVPLLGGARGGLKLIFKL